jgi:hypothetical protein
MRKFDPGYLASVRARVGHKAFEGRSVCRHSSQKALQLGITKQAGVAYCMKLGGRRCIPNMVMLPEAAPDATRLSSRAMQVIPSGPAKSSLLETRRLKEATSEQQQSKRGASSVDSMHICRKTHNTHPMFGGCHHSSPTPTVIHHEKNAQSGPALRVRRISPTVDLLKDLQRLVVASELHLVLCKIASAPQT